MGLLMSWLVFIAGAILQFGLATGPDYVNEIGVLLMIIGALGFVLSLIFWESGVDLRAFVISQPWSGKILIHQRRKGDLETQAADGVRRESLHSRIRCGGL